MKLIAQFLWHNKRGKWKNCFWTFCKFWRGMGKWWLKVNILVTTFFPCSCPVTTINFSLYPQAFYFLHKLKKKCSSLINGTFCVLFFFLFFFFLQQFCDKIVWNSEFFLFFSPISQLSARDSLFTMNLRSLISIATNYPNK